MLDNIRHGIALFDADDRIVAVNRIFRQLLEVPDELLEQMDDWNRRTHGASGLLDRVRGKK